MLHIVLVELIALSLAVSLCSYTCSTSIFLSRVGVTNPSAGMHYELTWSLYYPLSLSLCYLLQILFSPNFDLCAFPA